MGRYYHPCFLNEKRNRPVKAFCAWDYHNGAKLMEFSYIGNNFMAAVENALIDNPQSLVFAGDYADEEKGCKKNLYQFCTEKMMVKDGNQNSEHLNDYFVINHTKKLYYKRSEVEKHNGFRVNPLALLTAEGNGRGSGDYYGKEETDKLVGQWARDLIELSETEPEGYTKENYHFAWRW